jgi:hypothetical protein
MENIVSNFESPEISIKLTDEKLYIRTPTTSETFALRSVNGVGIVDLVDIYNKELTEYKNAKSPTYPYVIGGFMLFAGLVNFSVNVGAAIICLLIGGGIMLWGTTLKAASPTLKTAVRIMISGVNRDFEFDKAGSYTSQIAELVVKIEETLTAYHKNNK